MNSALVLNDRYRLVEPVATGGMGEVWAARDEAAGRLVAVKLLRDDLPEDVAARERMAAEAEYASRLRHEGIARVYDHGTHRGRAYLVMELVRGEPLAAVLARVGRLTAWRTLDLVAQAARALAAAHRAGIVHRDVKPDNLLVTADGTVKITDFGIARGPKPACVTAAGRVMGSAHYLSPEQATGQELTPAVDLYALGVVAYECLAGRVPFDGDTTVDMALKHVREVPPPLPDDVPADVRALVSALLSKDPAERFGGDAHRVAERAAALRDTLPAPDAPSGSATARSDAPGVRTGVSRETSALRQDPAASSDASRSAASGAQDAAAGTQAFDNGSYSTRDGGRNGSCGAVPARSSTGAHGAAEAARSASGGSRSTSRSTRISGDALGGSRTGGAWVRPQRVQSSRGDAPRLPRGSPKAVRGSPQSLRGSSGNPGEPRRASGAPNGSPEFDHSMTPGTLRLGNRTGQGRTAPAHRTRAGAPIRGPSGPGGPVPEGSVLAGSGSHGARPEGLVSVRPIRDDREPHPRLRPGSTTPYRSASPSEKPTTDPTGAATSPPNPAPVPTGEDHDSVNSEPGSLAGPSRGARF
ncbi:MAG: serine/threonine protein kinase [Actinomadura rubrobrunea]|nr:serine/threonine protein kinase [Actinomadura rubrobrunea]